MDSSIFCVFFQRFFQILYRFFFSEFCRINSEFLQDYFEGIKIVVKLLGWKLGRILPLAYATKYDMTQFPI